MLSSGSHAGDIAPPAPHRRDEQRCVVTGIVGERASMLRLALAPSNTMFADISYSGLGSGVFVSAAPEAVKKAAQLAVAGKLFDGVEVSLGDVSSAEEFAAAVADRITERLLNTLGLVRKAGDVVAGHTKVMKAFDGGELGIVINATDAAQNGCEKIFSRARRLQVGCARAFASETLGAAIGRGATMHVAVRAGASAARIWRELLTLNAFGRVNVDVGLKHA